MLYNRLKVFACLVLICSCSSSMAYNHVNAQEEFIITKEDIINAVPTPADVLLSKKEEHEIEIMEKRHFEKIYRETPAKKRVLRLEKYLLGRSWEFSPLQDRMRRLKLASQRRALAGTSLPIGIRKYVSPQRIANDSTPIYQDDSNVGLIDGLLRLYAPDAYNSWSNRKKRINEAYNDG